MEKKLRLNIDGKIVEATGTSIKITENQNFIIDKDNYRADFAPGEKGVVLKYYFPAATDAGIDEHPKPALEKMGYRVLRFAGEPIADAVFFEVEKIINPLPSYLAISDYNFHK